MADPDILAVIDRVYAAALEPERWQEALDAICRSIGTMETTMLPPGSGIAMPSFVSESLTAAKTDDPETQWRHDMPGAPDRGVRPEDPDRPVTSDEEIRKDPFHHEAMAVLSAHIGRAVSIAATLMEARYVAANLAAVVEQLAWGVVRLDASGQAQYVNPVAQALLGDGFDIAKQRPRAALPEDDARLQKAIAAALSGSTGAPGDGFLLRRSSGQVSLYVEVVPIRPKLDTLEILACAAGGAMLLIRSLAVEPRSIAQLLRQMGLTATEARIAEAVGRGGSLRSIAEAQGIAYETARAHLRSVFGKLGIGRQAGLAVLITQLIATTGG